MNENFPFLKTLSSDKDKKQKLQDFQRKTISNVTDPVKYVLNKHKSRQLGQAGLKLNQSLKLVSFTAPSKSLLHNYIYLFVPKFLYLYL